MMTAHDAIYDRLEGLTGLNFTRVSDTEAAAVDYDYGIILLGFNRANLAAADFV